MSESTYVDYYRIGVLIIAAWASDRGHDRYFTRSRLLSFQKNPDAPKLNLEDNELLVAALESLTEDGVFEYYPDDLAPDLYVPAGSTEAALFNDESSVAAKHSAAGDWWLAEAIEEINSRHVAEQHRPTEAESQNQDWEPLPLDREDPIVAEAIGKTEQALEIIEGDNGFAVNLPSERNSIVSSIKAGIEALRSGVTTKALIGTALIAPLGYIAVKFMDSAMGVAADAAVQALLRVLGGG